MGAVLITALLVPLLGAVATLLVPSGAPRPSRPRRAATKNPETTRGKRRARRHQGGDKTVDDGTVSEGIIPGPLSAPASLPATETVTDTETYTETDTEVERDTPARAESDPDALEAAGRVRRTIVRVTALVSAALWVAVAVGGPTTAGPWTAEGVVAPAAAGAALMLAGAGGPPRRLAAAGSSLALSLAAAGLALATSDEGAALAVSALAAAVVVLALSARRPEDGGLGPAALALGGTAALAGGLLGLEVATGSVDLPARASLAPGTGLLLVAGSVAVALSAALRPRRALGLLLPVALGLGIPPASELGAIGDVVATVVFLAAAAVAGWWALAPRSPRGDPRPLVAILALVAIGVAASSTTGVPGDAAALAGLNASLPAAWLLASAAVVTAVVLAPIAALSAVPGFAAFLVIVGADPQPPQVALAALGVGGAIALAAALCRPSADDGDVVVEAPSPVGPLFAAIPALAAGAFLLVAPQRWSWVGAVDLQGWTDTGALVLAGGLVSVLLAGSTGRLSIPKVPLLVGTDPMPTQETNPISARIAMGAGLVLIVLVLALLASSGT